MTKAWDFDLETKARSLDFNPNKQYHVAFGCDDGSVKFYDLRKANKGPIKSLEGHHSHWVWCVRFNEFHDQLVLTSSSDARVTLTCMASISSEPQGRLVDDLENETSSLSDGVLKVYDDHEESVYAVAWANSDPWTFASLSYDGRLVINHVPRKVKFKILNLA